MPSVSCVPDRAPRRLTVVSDAVLPWHQGGKEQRHHELYQRLARRGFAVTVATMHWWDGPRRIERDGITYVALCAHRPIYHGQRRSITQAVVFALACSKLLWHRFDVVEADAIPFLPLLPVRLVCWMRRRPMVTTWHEFWGTDYWVSYLGARGRLAALVERSAVRLPDRVIACSQETADRLSQTHPGPRDVVVVPNGIATDRSVPRLRSARVPGAPLRLLVAGRLLENKRVDLALEAVRRLLDDGIDLTCDVVGDGPARPGLEELVASLGLGDHVRFRGFIAGHEDVLDAMADADLLLSTSTREGFGMVALEAMSVGTPVVTVDHPDNAARHLVDDRVNGRLSAVDPGAVAAAITWCADHLDALGVGARRTAADYDWEQLADRAAEAYGGRQSASARLDMSPDSGIKSSLTGPRATGR